MTAKIRIATRDDADAVRAIYAPFVTSTHVSFELEVPETGEVADRMERVLTHHPWLVAEIDGNVVGFAYGTTFRGRPAYDWSVETSIYVAESARGHGVGLRLYGALLDVLEFQGFCTAIAGIALPNPGSVAFHERLGFVHRGDVPDVGRKFDQAWAIGFWTRPLRNEVAPKPIRPFPSVADGNEVRDLLL